MTVALIVVGLTAGLLAVGSRMPALADDTCPAGLPSRTATASATTTSTSVTAAAKTAAAGTARTATSAAAPAKAATKTGTEASPSASPSKSGSGNKIVDGVQSIIDGVGNLLGLGDDPSATPSASPSPSETTTAEPTKTADPEPTKTTEPTGTTTAAPTTTTAGPTAASSSPSSNVIPCLGPRVLGLQANADDVPSVADQPGLLETASLTMYNSTYDGVVTLTTGSGNKVRVLKFTMDKAVNTPFSLNITGSKGSHTVITSNELDTIGTVKFYTERFEGKLFGVIPVVFTPDQPPPLTLPILWFTDAKIQLNYIRCDTLTGVPLHISQQD